jgi:hypothetical protein
MYKFIDDNGHIWVWDARGERIYSVEAEIESLKKVLDGECYFNNGYLATSISHAAQVMIDGGYTEKPIRKLVWSFKKI